MINIIIKSARALGKSVVATPVHHNHRLSFLIKRQSQPFDASSTAGQCYILRERSFRILLGFWRSLVGTITTKEFKWLKIDLNFLFFCFVLFCFFPLMFSPSIISPAFITILISVHQPTWSMKHIFLNLKNACFYVGMLDGAHYWKLLIYQCAPETHLYMSFKIS